MAKSLAGYYALSLVGFAATVAAVLRFAPASARPPASPLAVSPGDELVANLQSPLGQALIQVLVIVVTARIVGSLFARIGQPAVVGEMAAGIALGPSLLGTVWPSAERFLFPAQSLGALSILSQIGILLFMFVVGMELDVRLLRQKAQTAVLVSHASIILPFLIGLTSSLWLYNRYAGMHSAFLPFALFMGISVSITAFPVLARILQERGLVGTELGNIAITCAAIDDITAWIALAFIVAVAKSTGFAGWLLTTVLTGGVVALALLVLRPMLNRLVASRPDPGNPGKSATAKVLVCVFLCALATEAIGIHALFGAFLAGVAIPENPAFRSFLRQRIEYFSTLFLVPIFFAFTGLRTQIGLLSGATDWLICLSLLLLAVAGKFGGSTLAARASGMSWRESSALGALMNTRGLIELIALNLGLDLGVLSPSIFAMLVLMALLTTFMTGPMLAMLGFGPSTGDQAVTES